MTLHIDPATLDGIASTLQAAGTDLDSTANGAPKAIDGGDATAAVLGILTGLTQDAAQLVVGLEAAGKAVADANAKYKAQDHETADSLITAWAEH